MKIGPILEVVGQMLMPLVRVIQKRRARKLAEKTVEEALQGFGDEGGHPQPFPLEEARRRARARREASR